jgi:hypothetical protein
MFCNMVTLTVEHGDQFLLFPSALVSPSSCSCASLQKMVDKGKLYVEQCIKTIFFTETRSVVVTQRRFCAHFQTQWRLHSEQFLNFITSLIMMVQCKRGNIASHHFCVHQRTLTLSEWHCKEAPVNQQ